MSSEGQQAGGRPACSFVADGRPLYAVALSGDGKTVATAGLGGTIYLYDLGAGKWGEGLEGHRDAVYSLAFSPDGKQLVAGAGDCSITVWSLPASGAWPEARVTARLEGHGEAIYEVRFGADGRRIVSAGTDGQVVVWDAQSGQALYSHRFPGKTLCAALAPDGQNVATGTGQAACYLMELPPHVR
jgi:WD40 repeat protein